MSNEKLLNKILNFIRVNNIWTIIGVLTGIIGVPSAIWAISEHNKKPNVGISIAGQSITENGPFNVYYLIPQEYYDAPTGGSIILDIFNSGTTELNNIKVYIDAQAIIETKPTTIVTSGNIRTIDNKELRLHRLLKHDYYSEDIVGESITLSYYDYKEQLSFVCSNLPDGMIKRIQLFFNIDREYINKLNKDYGNMKGSKFYDAFAIDISYGATNVSSNKIRLPIAVIEELGINEIVDFYEKEGQLFSGTWFDKIDMEKGFVNNILIYPKYIVNNGVINVSVEDAQYYYVKFDTFFKEKNKRRITIVNLNTLETKTFVFKDTPERRVQIKQFYDITGQGLMKMHTK